MTMDLPIPVQAFGFVIYGGVVLLILLWWHGVQQGHAEDDE